MPYRQCGVVRVALWSLWMTVGVLARAAGFNHWLVTEEGKIEFQIGSPFNLRQPFNLHALLQQEERVSSLEVLRYQLLNFRDQFEGFGDYDSFEESFYALDAECRNVPSVTTFDLFISAVLPLDTKQISLSDHLDPAHSRFPGEPYCITPLDYSMYALEHLAGVQERHSVVIPAEKSVLSSVHMNIETFGNLVHHALQKNSTSWVLLDLATLYWRARGSGQNAIECIRRALHYSPTYAADIAYLNLANVLHRGHDSADAVIPLKLAIEISPNINILHYMLGNVYVSMAQLNESIPEYQYSLSLEPTSEPVLSVYSSVLCEIRKLEASMEYGRKLDETQAKLDEFYEKVELVQKNQIVEKGHRGQWDIKTKRRSERAAAAAKDEEQEDDENGLETGNEEVSREAKEGEREGEGEGVMEESDGGSKVPLTHDETEMVDMTTTTSDSGTGDSVQDDILEVSGNGTDSSAMPPNRGSSRFRLVLRPLEDSECSCCESGTSPGFTPPVVPSSDSIGTSQMGRPVCRLPSPFLNYSRYPSGYCAETWQDCTEIEKMGKPGTHICEVKGETTSFTYPRGNDVTKVSSLNCAIDESNQNDCLKALQEQLRLIEQRRFAQKERVLLTEQAKQDSLVTNSVKNRDDVTDTVKNRDDNADTVKNRYDTAPKTPSITASAGHTSSTDNSKGGSKKGKESEFSSLYRGLEFLPYNPLPMEMEELIFPDRSRPLAIFDDPYWPNKASCLKLAESLRGTSSSLSTFTGTYLSPEAKGVETKVFFKIVPYPVPHYLRQRPRCTDIVELPFSLQAMDHLYPVQYRSQLKENKKHTENGLKQVLMNAVSSAMGQTLSFEESGEAVYAAMVKNGPNWALFVIASLYWRVSGDPKHSIECLRRALYYSPSSVRDVGYVGLANVFHRHGYMSEAVIATRASLDIMEDLPVGHYTMAGIYLTLKDYIASSLHLRTALHQQPTFEHALSALRLVRCYLKFKAEQEQLRQQLTIPEGRQVQPHETTLAIDLTRAIETLRAHERVRQPPQITKPAEVISREGERDMEGYFTGEDAVRYMTNLAIRRNRRKKELEMMGKREREEREAIERRLREEILKVESDGSLEEFIKEKRSREGENEFAKQIRYEPNQLDITPLMKQVANRIQAENNNYDPQLIAQSRAEIEAELRDIVLESARAIASNQSPRQHTTPTQVVANGNQPTHDSPANTENEEREESSSNSDKDVVTPDNGDKDLEKTRSRKSKDGQEEMKRYPGYQPWPSLQDCAAMSLSKTLVYTSTWLSVTAKKIRVDEHVDFESKLEDLSLKPYCHPNFKESTKTFSNLAGMNRMGQAEHYKPERGLIEVFTNLSGSYRSVEDVATRINISMTKNESSWVLSNLAALYWRIEGDGEMAIDCLKHSLHFSDNSNKEVALVSLANILYRMGYDSDATAVMQHSLEVNPKLVVNHFTMANLLAARGFAAEAAGYFESTLQFQPGFEPAAERLKAVRCISLLKHIQEMREKEERKQKEYEAELERQLYERRKALGHFD